MRCANTRGAVLDAIPRSNVYGYDQLNRLRKVRTATNAIANVDNWQYSDAYNEQLNYDPNGNILTNIRNGTAATLAMDSLLYHYKPNTNQLDYVTDPVPAGNYDVDIDEQDTLNYLYTAIGELSKDVAEGIDTFQ